MSDEDPNDEPSSDERGENVFDTHFLLTLLARQVQQFRMSIGVTLWVGGQIITGDMIAIQEYLHEIAAALDQTQQATKIGEMFTSGMVNAIQDGLNKRNDSEPRELADIAIPTFLHLRAPAIVYETQVVPLTAPLAVRLDSVDAWILGRMNVKRAY